MLTLQKGQEVVGCIVVGPIGQGGMGAVYKVFDPKLEVHRALKVMALPPGTAASAMAHYEKRFAQEARNLAQLRHPGVVTVLSFGELDGPGSPQYLLMEYINGQTLTDWIQSENPSLDRVLNVAKQLASALKAIHGKGILHRDIKLTNLLVNKPHGSEEEHLIVIDFGLAKTDDDEKLTQTGAIAGTSWYLAPEYVSAAFDSHGEVAVSHTVLTDLWAVGCVLYSLCTHRSVLKAKSAITIHEEIRRAAISPVEDYRSDISAEFAAVVMGLLVADPTKRIQSAAALLDALQRVTQARDPTKAPFVPPSKERASANTALAATSSGRSEVLTTPGLEPGKPLAVHETNSSRPSLEDGALSEFSFPSAAVQTLTPNAPPRQLGDEGSLSEFSFPSAAPMPQAAKEESLFPVSFAPPASGPNQEPPAALAEAPPSAVLNSAHEALRAPPVGAPSDVPAQAAPLASSVQEPSGAPQEEASIWSAALSGNPEPSAVYVPPQSPQVDNAMEQMSAPTPMVAAHEPPVVKPAFVPDIQQAATSSAPARAMMIPVIVGLMVASGVGALLFWGESAVKVAKPNNGFVDPDAINTAKAEREMRALKKETAGTTTSLVGAPTRVQVAQAQAPRAVAIADAQQHPAPPVRETPVSRRLTSTRRGAGGGGSKAPAASAEPTVDYSAYGLRAADSAVTGNASMSGGKSTSAATSTANVAGIRIPVTLKGSIVSTPPGPVTAVVTKSTKFGDTTPEGDRDSWGNQGGDKRPHFSAISRGLHRRAESLFQRKGTRTRRTRGNAGNTHGGRRERCCGRSNGGRITQRRRRCSQCRR